MKRREYHGKCGTKVYRAWEALRNRCENPNNRAYADYGGRGITVCERWSKFANFLHDMGEPLPGQSIDRIDNDKGYGPENCRWASRKEQNRNKRSLHLITAGGRTQLLSQWAEELGVTHRAILGRIKTGWSEEEAVMTPRVTKRKGIKRGEKIRLHQGTEQGVVFRDLESEEAA